MTLIEFYALGYTEMRVRALGRVMIPEGATVERVQVSAFSPDQRAYVEVHFADPDHVIPEGMIRFPVPDKKTLKSLIG